MKKAIKIAISIAVLVLVVSVGERVRVYFDGDYRAHIQAKTWNERVSDYIENIEAESLANDLFSTFGKVDSVQILESIGCYGGYFGRLDSKYVLKIPSSIYSEEKGTTTYSLDELGEPCELIIFNKGEAHLGNICTDLIQIGLPKANRILTTTTGKIKVYIGNPEPLWRDTVNNAYVEIERMTFFDSESNQKKIEIKHKYLWKVVNLGTPG